MKDLTNLKKPDYDTFGYCVKCGELLIEPKVIDGIYKIRMKGNYTTVSYKLNDGSNMRVAMCKNCANNLTGNEDEKLMIMAKVWRGWQKETETYSNWKRS